MVDLGLCLVVNGFLIAEGGCAQGLVCLGCSLVRCRAMQRPFNAIAYAYECALWNSQLCGLGVRDGAESKYATNERLGVTFDEELECMICLPPGPVR